MLNTNFCRCKALLKLSQSVLNAEIVHKIESRCYTAKVIYSSEAPNELKYKSENSTQQEQTFKNRNFVENEIEYDETKRKPRRSHGQHRLFKNKFTQKESHTKNYSHRDNSYEVKNKHTNTVEKNCSAKEKMHSMPNLFDTNYVLLDNTNKIRIKPKSPLEEDDFQQYDNKIYKRNYKITDNPSYHNKLSYKAEHEDDEGAQIESGDCDNKDTSTNKRRKKYSFDSSLVFKEDIDDVSPLNLDLTMPSDKSNINDCTDDTNNNNSRTDSKSITTNLRPRYKTIETAEGLVTLNLADDEFDINDFVKEFNENIPGPLDECTEDISYFGPDFSPTFNFAAYADKSKLIQQYVKLGVKLYKLEKNMDHMTALLSVDLEKELPIYIQFLHDCGVPANCLGDAITENPMILKEDLDDMKTRIRYLRAHNFAPGSIARIITKNPSWLVWATKFIDERLGHFQNEFKLRGSEVRFLATKAPKLITYPMRHINENTFAVKEEMGFNKLQTKLLLLYKPRLWMNNRKKILDSFDYLHNTMNLSHVTIATQADVMATRRNRIKSRHEFLVELKKAQYDPKKPGYVAPKTMVIGSDVDFCRNVAKTSIDTYNLFLKTR